MTDKLVTLGQNQLQDAPGDRAVARGIAANRIALIRSALKEQAAKQARVAPLGQPR